ncbi:DUF2254 domain-containing protein [Saxibacter everestensis]|uniref:DUF2254 domain-containing protein n=1 Tax=Saxibacter everestensis TaxID=2909229 RepID=A0ABY8QUU9_9MICO|nr:DUF2254 domain-containing protein [Brevibacteriaceae bacterium ZFBP1038]
MKRFRIGHYLKTSLWFLPLLFVLGGVILSLIATAIDNGSLIPQSITGDPTAAMQILYLIAFAMLTLTGLLLSLLVVAVQLAMGTFSPRIVRQILQDRPSQSAIGLFAATFAFAMLAMRKVRTTADGGSVPGLAVLIAIVLVVGCIGTLIWYLNHIAQSLRVAALTGWVSEDTMKSLDRVYPDHGPQQPLDPSLITTPHSGVVFEVDHDRLVDLARKSGCRLELLWAVGDFVPTGAALVRVAGEPAVLSARAVTASIAIGPERTLNQDVAYGLRMLVDIAIRSLSSGPFEDPTTTVQAIDRLHDIMRQLARRPLHSGEHHDADGTLRLLAPTMQWGGYVRLAFDELRQAGAASPQVVRRLRSALDDLLTVVPEERRPDLEHQLELLGDLSSAAAPTKADRRMTQVPDPSGLGSAADLLTPTSKQQ